MTDYNIGTKQKNILSMKFMKIINFKKKLGSKGSAHTLSFLQKKGVNEPPNHASMYTHSCLISTKLLKRIQSFEQGGNKPGFFF